MDGYTACIKFVFEHKNARDQTNSSITGGVKFITSHAGACNASSA